MPVPFLPSTEEERAPSNATCRCLGKTGPPLHERATLVGVPDLPRADLPPQQFATWIRPLPLRADADGVRLVAPNRFVLQWVKDRFGPRISTMGSATPPATTSASSSPSRPQATPVAQPSRRPASPPHPCRACGRAVPAARLRTATRGSVEPQSNAHLRQLRHRKANQLAARLRCRSPSIRLLQPPVHLWRRGLGKTHLIQASATTSWPRTRPPRSATPTPSPTSPTSSRLPAQELRGVQAALPLARPAADRHIQFLGGKSRTRKSFLLFNTMIEAHSRS